MGLKIVQDLRSNLENEVIRERSVSQQRVREVEAQAHQAGQKARDEAQGQVERAQKIAEQWQPSAVRAEEMS